MSESEFQIGKAIAFAAALIAATVAQFVFPHRRSIGAVFANWKANLPLALLNLVIVNLVCGGCVCLVAHWAALHEFGFTNLIKMPLSLRIGAGIVVLDFIAFSWHRANHHWPFLWRFHAVHHSDIFFDSSTALRFHPGEILISLVVRVAVVTAVGIPVVGIFAFEVVYVFCNFFEHGNIRLSLKVEKLLSTIFVTPALHRKHHSVNRAELNSNFGTIFSVWDQLFKTHANSSSIENITVGLPGQNGVDRRIGELLRMPFVRRA